jgi:hypothetical protein
VSGRTHGRRWKRAESADRVAKERTRPGSDPSEKVYERVVDAYVGSTTTSGKLTLQYLLHLSLVEGWRVGGRGEIADRW